MSSTGDGSGVPRKDRQEPCANNMIPQGLNEASSRNQERSETIGLANERIRNMNH